MQKTRPPPRSEFMGSPRQLHAKCSKIHSHSQAHASSSSSSIAASSKTKENWGGKANINLAGREVESGDGRFQNLVRGLQSATFLLALNQPPQQIRYPRSSNCLLSNAEIWRGTGARKVGRPTRNQNRGQQGKAQSKMKERGGGRSGNCLQGSRWGLRGVVAQLREGAEGGIQSPALVNALKELLVAACAP